MNVTHARNDATEAPETINDANALSYKIPGVNLQMRAGKNFEGNFKQRKGTHAIN